MSSDQLPPRPRFPAPVDGAWRIRPAGVADTDAFLALARKTGGGFTNLPPDRDELARKLANSETAMQPGVDHPGGELYLLALEETASGAVRGTAALFSKIGIEWPFYSFRIARITQVSKQLDKTLQSDVLSLVNDFDGHAEVGGLFLDPDLRAGGLGRQLARSRYLFIAQNRNRFADNIIAELRGYQAPDGSWPFWEGLGRKFLDMAFEDADRFNSLNGNQFISDLMPKYPIYVRLLPDAAQAAMGRPHPDGARALALLQEEGFHLPGYIDIFDGGPTVAARVDDLKTIAQSETAVVGPLHAFAADEHSRDSLVAAGQAAGFRAARGRLAILEDGQVAMSAALAAALEVEPGDEVRHVRF